MTLEEFKKEYNNAPFDEEKFAHIIMEITNCKKLTDITEVYLTALDGFHMILSDYDIEMG